MPILSNCSGDAGVVLDILPCHCTSYKGCVPYTVYMLFSSNLTRFLWVYCMYCNSFGNVLMYVHVFCVRGVSDGLWACPHACSCYTTHTCTHMYTHIHTHLWYWALHILPFITAWFNFRFWFCLQYASCNVSVCCVRCQRNHIHFHIYIMIVYTACMYEWNIYSIGIFNIWVHHACTGHTGATLPHAALSKHETKLGVGMVVGQGDGSGRRREW